MKLKAITAALALAALSTINAQLSTAFAQGSLTPPGAPAPTMKSLDQIESRIPISAIPLIITNSGSYYLTTNVMAAWNGYGILILTNDVTLDLNGFSITTTNNANTLPGIHFNQPVTNITIMNGSIARFGAGIFAYSTIKNVLVSRIQVRNVNGTGIYVDNKGSKAEHCSVADCNGTGIYATVVDNCAVNASAGIGIQAQNVINSSALNAGFDGIIAATAMNCTGTSSAGGYGITVTDSAMNCQGESVTGVGLKATVAMNCTGQRSGGRAIEATVANGCYAVSGTNLITYKYNMP